MTSCHLDDSVVVPKDNPESMVSPAGLINAHPNSTERRDVMRWKQNRRRSPRGARLLVCFVVAPGPQEETLSPLLASPSRGEGQAAQRNRVGSPVGSKLVKNNFRRSAPLILNHNSKPNFKRSAPRKKTGRLSARN